MNPGTCLALQVGVNAPGTANITTLPVPKSSPVSASRGPSGVAVISFIAGILSPVLNHDRAAPPGFAAFVAEAPWRVKI